MLTSGNPGTERPAERVVIRATLSQHLFQGHLERLALVALS